MLRSDIQALALAMHDELVAHRRDFHQHPELAFEEVRTAKIVAEELRTLGIEVQTGVAKTGVVGILEGVEDGPTVLLRADMDALPIQEDNPVEYASQQSGKMHACGHDGHIAIALGVARLLASQRDRMAGRVKFIFQPAEEVGQGALAMAEAGVLRDPQPDVSVGLHLWNALPLGTLGLAEGAIMASASDFVIRIEGKGGHGALPDETRDPVVCAAQMVLALQTIVSRNVHPQETVVLSVTQVHAGTAFNVIPQSAFLNGTIRTFSRETRDFVVNRMHTVINGIAASMECAAELEVTFYTEPVVNDPAVTRRMRRVATALGYTDETIVEERTMGSEDVGVFMTETPGVFFLLGSANEERELSYPHHHPRFDFDEAVLSQGVALLSAAVADYVLPEVR